MAGLLDYVNEQLVRGDYPDVGGTMESIAEFRNPVIDRFENMANEQALTDVSDIAYGGLLGLGRGIGLLGNIPKGQGMLGMHQGKYGRLPIDAPVTTKPSPMLEEMYGKELAYDLWMRNEAAKRGKQYTTERLDEFLKPSFPERIANTSREFINDKSVQPFLYGNNAAMGIGDRITGGE